MFITDVCENAGKQRFGKGIFSLNNHIPISCIRYNSKKERGFFSTVGYIVLLFINASPKFSSPKAFETEP